MKLGKCVSGLPTEHIFFGFSYVVDLLEKLEFALWSNLIANRLVRHFEYIHSYPMAYA